MLDYVKEIGATRGSALYYDANGALRNGLEEAFRLTVENGASRQKVQEVQLTLGGFVAKWRNVRPIPIEEDFFENVWRSYRENKNIV